VLWWRRPAVLQHVATFIAAAAMLLTALDRIGDGRFDWGGPLLWGFGLAWLAASTLPPGGLWRPAEPGWLLGALAVVVGPLFAQSGRAGWLVVGSLGAAALVVVGVRTRRLWVAAVGIGGVFVSVPLAVAELFDKNATSERLAAHDIPCPPALPAPDTPEELLERLRQARFGTAYVKLNTGSSASAIAVVRAGDDPPWAISSLVRIGDEFASSRRLQHHAGVDLRAVLGFLLAEGACVQRGIRMAQVDGQNFDVRVVVIHGTPAFTVFRLSSQPMTNLHLGGRRGDPARCRAAIPTRAWLDGLDHCVEAARLYDSAAVGVDLLFESGYLRHYLLEVNAFGDFFPGLADDRGRGVHAVEIEASARAHGLIES